MAVEAWGARGGEATIARRQPSNPFEGSLMVSVFAQALCLVLDSQQVIMSGELK